MTEREFVSGLIGLVVGSAIASVFVGIVVDDSWRKYCVSKGAATYVQIKTNSNSPTTTWAWKEDQ